MIRRYPLPTLWLLTDERQGDALWGALATLPRGAGVIMRHYGLAAPARRALFERIRAIARRRGLLLLLAGTPATARAWKADGAYGAVRTRVGSASGRQPRHCHAYPVHDLREIRAAERAGAGFLLLSPLHPTRSHPGARVLGRVRFANLARQTQLPVIALGGMNAATARGLKRLGAAGWAAIDAFA